MRRRGMSHAAIEAALLVENKQRCQPPLDDEEVCKIARSVGRYSPSGDGHRGLAARRTVGSDTSKQSGYEIIRSYMDQHYRPVFRRGEVLYSSSLGREVKRSDALAGCPHELIDQLAMAVDAPANDSGVQRSRLPNFFKQWAPSAWVDILDAQPEEPDASEIVEPAADEARAIVSRALHTIVAYAATYRPGQSERTDVERRSLLEWCVLWAKPGAGRRFAVTSFGRAAIAKQETRAASGDCTSGLLRLCSPSLASPSVRPSDLPVCCPCTRSLSRIGWAGAAAC